MLYKYIESPLWLATTTDWNESGNISKKHKGENKSITLSQLYKYGILCCSNVGKSKYFFIPKLALKKLSVLRRADRLTLTQLTSNFRNNCVTLVYV